VSLLYLTHIIVNSLACSLYKPQPNQRPRSGIAAKSDQHVRRK